MVAFVNNIVQRLNYRPRISAVNASLQFQTQKVMSFRIGPLDAVFLGGFASNQADELSLAEETEQWDRLQNEMLSAKELDDIFSHLRSSGQATA
jgi:hypothetical protein